MWKRIHSNRDPRDTLYSEIRREFGTYFLLAGNAWKCLLSKYPKFLFGTMILFLLTSAALSFTIFRNEKKAVAIVSKTTNPIQDGFSQIMAATDRIRETLDLKKIVDSLGRKKRLDFRDSLTLDSALDRLQAIKEN
ncbi:hypothetical protein SNE26_24130 [Mucilaginibacter sp. cycad4]|uniref:hypothetical protein n=1 Tax=Mucilaginibacter sp. cycad4 TaxID=3342096 RepID=UPI002AAAFC8C|nr:hypothetical protein [Mucilaginibacter gossypii]WPU99105.1 hypothetical protein SNE26_24130 [Mucilaginibacter gossypii]